MSYGQLVADAQLVKCIRRVLEGIQVDDEYLAIDVIKQVGPRGHFLDQDHTIRHMRELLRTDLCDRTNSRETWEKSGAKGLITKAEERAREILETHKAKPLPENIAARVNSIVEEAEKELAVPRKDK